MFLSAASLIAFRCDGHVVGPSVASHAYEQLRRLPPGRRAPTLGAEGMAFHRQANADDRRPIASQDAAPTGSDRPLCAKWFRQTKSGGTTDRPKPKCHASGMLTVEVPTAEAAHVAATKAAHVAAAKAAHVATTEAAEVVATKAVRVAEVSSG